MRLSDIRALPGGNVRISRLSSEQRWRENEMPDRAFIYAQMLRKRFAHPIVAVDVLVGATGHGIKDQCAVGFCFNLPLDT
jgi:hypothetical protein